MRVVFIGSGEFGIPTLRALAAHRDYRLQGVVTQIDRPSGRHRLPTPCPIKAAALDLRLPIFQPERINSPAAVEQIRFLQPDVLIVVAYGQILSREVLELPSRAALNLHASLLPRHRGAAPIQAAIRSRDRESGVTVIWMDEGLDTGDILLAKKLLIRSTDTTATLQARLAKLGSRAVIEALDCLASGRAQRQPQDPAQATYARKLRKEDGEIDWTRDKWDIHAHIRAMNPWPVAYTWLRDGGELRMLKVFSGIVSIRASGRPGEIVRIDSHGILVAAGGSGGLLLREVQLEGKRRMPAAEFARGMRLSVGSAFGGEGLSVGYDRAAGGTLS
ncbi:10-formyltetrahydrofolate:L-methionyl-tRNA(fMet) N-formyltransferase [Methylacidimicrobium sp. AP8]|uniref:methionyl-tRNA formyltransferase n=1 Tax=Methylacidimicrobium sp. AP8 TaxID=2730359 RepID=UPI0018C14B3E|nr:methionyl-tRNA formyltransferase [Methylacidimicrobium sp. AP8]CAB4242496.1 10-formyltetrahydrofolate:L-methionyl-tRNA(fMet) N-formyltransferase [Methylacidimicrobium sp. AP8]